MSERRIRLHKVSFPNSSELLSLCFIHSSPLLSPSSHLQCCTDSDAQPMRRRDRHHTGTCFVMSFHCNDSCYISELDKIANRLGHFLRVESMTTRNTYINVAKQRIINVLANRYHSLTELPTQKAPGALPKLADVVTFRTDPVLPAHRPLHLSAV